MGMANPEKHKKNPIMEWLGDEETELGCQARAARVVGGGDKLSKAVARKPPVLVPPVAAKPDPALMREAAPPHRLNERHSQASSPEHLRKLQRLPRLRAPIASKPSSPRPR
jgi:hypothetical protein